MAGLEGPGHDMSPAGAGEAGDGLCRGVGVGGGIGAGGVVMAGRGSLRSEPNGQNRLVDPELGSGIEQNAERKGRCSRWIWWDRREGIRGRR
jgi:hypothetical protein